MHVVRKLASYVLIGAIASALLTACGGSNNTVMSTTPPTAGFSDVITGLSVTFQGTGAAADGTTPIFSWSFGDGGSAIGATATHVYAGNGAYTVALTVTDDHGTTASRVQTVTVAGAAAVSLEQWAWAAGAEYANTVGTYETVLKASPLNQPSSRQGAISWTNAQGQLLLFGGSGYDSAGTNGSLNDLWSFNSGTGEWTWLNGSNRANAIGVYGALGTYAPTNMPGGRAYAAHWIDAAGNMWLFGGLGYDAVGNTGFLNDMWKFNYLTAEAEWVGGANTVDVNGTFGTQGQGAATNVPSARAYAATWVDKSGNFWLFGGQTVNSSGSTEALNDLWMFNPSTAQWTWISGSSTTFNVAGTYGTMGTAAAANYPGARIGSVAWVDPASGKLWMFGGSGFDSVDAGGVLNDLWSYDPVANVWTWVGGTSVVGGAGVYGNAGIGAITNIPSSRAGSIGWVDASGTFWLFGGGGFDSTGISTTSDGGGELNDLWNYNPSTNKWAWMGGPTLASGSGVYATGVATGTASGSQTKAPPYPLVFSAQNTPGARMWSTGWTDSKGQFWLFGGTGQDVQATNGTLNDLWTIQLSVKPQ